jgi:DNA-binding response OmpR family regulator
MDNILIVSGQDLPEYAHALRADGHAVETSTTPAATPDAGVDLLVLDLTTVGEDETINRYLQGDLQHAPAIIAIIGPNQLLGFTPSDHVDDFHMAGGPPSELCVRVRQALWRRHRVDPKNILRCGTLVMDLAGYTVTIAGRSVDLTFKEYELLRFLATNRDRVLTREALLNGVWGYDFYGGARTVDVHIRRLRSKIEDRHRTFIETVRNVGYRFRVSS